MSGIKGHWFSLEARPDNTVHYEFFQYESLLQTGVCSSEEEAIKLFEQLVAQRVPGYSIPVDKVAKD